MIWQTKRYLLLVCIVLSGTAMHAQETTEPKKAKFSMAVFKDTVDGALDMSDFLINYHGFIPVAQLMTEPALGGFGLMFTPIFIQPNKHQVEGEYTPPDITAGFAGYTANDSWFLGGMRMASLPKHKLRYRIGAAYGDVNMDFYRELPIIGESEFGFNFNMVGAFGTLSRELGGSNLFVGLQYLYVHNELALTDGGDALPDFVFDKDLKSNISMVGISLEYDTRDNVFTPDKGWHITSNYRMNAAWTGSDYEFENLNLIVLKFFQTTKKLVSGFRFDGTAQYGKAPFYLVPGVALRGVPMSRYQGDDVYIVETEQRFDFTKRWSVLAFTGMAKATTEKTSFGDAELIYNYGAGMRYLIARKFGMRAGVDVAWSNEDFGWYITVGHAWNNRN